MNELQLLAQGSKAIEKQIAARQARLAKASKGASRAAAVVFQKALRSALPRKKGDLRRHVKVFPVGTTAYKAKVTGHVAHLVLGDVSQHEVDPRTSAEANSGRRRAIGPVLGKRALSFPGASHPARRALIPAHRGDHELIPRVKREAAPEAMAAAKEVLRT